MIWTEPEPGFGDRWPNFGYLLQLISVFTGDIQRTALSFSVAAFAVKSHHVALWKSINVIS